MLIRLLIQQCQSLMQFHTQKKRSRLVNNESMKSFSRMDGSNFSRVNKSENPAIVMISGIFFMGAIAQTASILTGLRTFESQ
ncbi:hypothetical protein H6F89_11395 [Cyanobacteria bacterium FACHB-63]|nr:hypothetical protein [Cyanobacteria bacterium FACHB-63]